MIMSGSNLETCEHFCEEMERVVVGKIEKIEKHPDADLYIHLGDGEREFEDVQNLYPDRRYLWVAGNCDFGSETKNSDLVKLSGKNVLITHGHTYYVKHSLSELKTAARVCRANVVLYGHTHVAHTEYDGGLYIMNPGSLSIPRQGGPTYGILDITSQGIMTNIVEV